MTNLTTKNIDHLGIVSGVCKEIGLVELIDKLTESDPQRTVSVGQGTYAMILNGLGFANQTLYLTPEYYSDKPVDVLFEGDLDAKDLNSHSLGSTLDALWESGVSRLFFHVALRGVKQYGVKTLSRHLDGTNFAVHGGKYKEEGIGVIELKRGHHKQGRHDLKLFVLELICSNVEGIPLFLKAASGNKTDKTEFPEVLEAYVEQMKQGKESWQEAPYIADSALYVEESLQRIREIKWISLVPKTIRQAQNQLKYSQKREWVELETHPGYKYQEQESRYGGIDQRWIIIWSENGYRRSHKTVERRTDKQHQSLLKSVKALQKQDYSSETQACKSVQKWYEDLKEKDKSYHDLGTIQVEEVKHYGRGRRKPDALPKSIDFKVQGVAFQRNEEKIEAEKQKKAKFILATNDKDADNLTPEQILQLYKNDQQQVERGFRFLKDPMFLLDHIFLKLPRRIMALSMVMGLCLLVYTLAQFKIRQALKKTGQSLPNQLKKPTQRPTMRWIFQLLKGIHVGYLKTTKGTQRFIVNLEELHIKILKLLGEKTMAFYTV